MKIIITDDFEKILKEGDFDVSFLKDEFKVEDVEEVKKEAFIAEKNKKTILIGAKKYNVFAQNALLKLLEEPPKNIDFVLLALSKYYLLDTILSRLPVEKKFFNKDENELEIKSITNDFIYEYFKKDLDKEEIKSVLKSLLKKAKNEEQLKIINDALLMLEFNIDKKAVISMVFLAFKERM